MNQEANNVSPAHEILKNAGPYVRIFPLPEQEKQMTAQLFALAERVYGKDSDQIIIDLVTDAERPYIKVNVDLAERFMRGDHKIRDDAPAASYDPGEHSAADVIKKLDEADEAEAARILALEHAGKARKTILAHRSQ